MVIEERVIGDITVLDLKGKMTLGEGDELLKDKINSLIHQGQKKLLLKKPLRPTRRPTRASRPASRRRVRSRTLPPRAQRLPRRLKALTT